MDFLCFRLCIWICTVYLDSGWIYIVCLDFFGFGFGFNGIWNLEEDLRLSFVSLVLFYFVWKALGQSGSVDWGFGPVASLVFGAGGLGHEAGGLRPPLASPAPTSLACPHRPRLPPWRGGGLGTGTRHWAPALAVGIGFSFCLFYI